jgi:biopolymer transport protein ExbB/TolQ
MTTSGGDFWSVLVDGGPLMLVLFMLALGIYWLAIDTLRTLHSAKYSENRIIAELSTVIDRRLYELENLRFMRQRHTHIQILVTTAPLIGLLGTVMGMLATFQGLNSANGDTIDLIAAGISEAMITTETGLVIAIPATFMVMSIGSKIQAIENILQLNKGPQ